MAIKKRIRKRKSKAKSRTITSPIKNNIIKVPRRLRIILSNSKAKSVSHCKPCSLELNNYHNYQESVVPGNREATEHRTTETEDLNTTKKNRVHEQTLTMTTDESTDVGNQESHHEEHGISFSSSEPIETGASRVCVRSKQEVNLLKRCKVSLVARNSNQEPSHHGEDGISFSSSEPIETGASCVCVRSKQEVNLLKSNRCNLCNSRFKRIKLYRVKHVPTLLKLSLLCIQPPLKEKASSQCEIDEHFLDMTVDKRTAILVNQKPPSDNEDPISFSRDGKMKTRTSKRVRVPSKNDIDEFKRFQCNLCYRRFKYEQHMSSHYKAMHVPMSLRKLSLQRIWPLLKETASNSEIDENNSSIGQEFSFDKTDIVVNQKPLSDFEDPGLFSVTEQIISRKLKYAIRRWSLRNNKVCQKIDFDRKILMPKPFNCLEQEIVDPAQQGPPLDLEKTDANKPDIDKTYSNINSQIIPIRSPNQEVSLPVKIEPPSDHKTIVSDKRKTNTDNSKIDSKKARTTKNQIKIKPMKLKLFGCYYCNKRFGNYYDLQHHLYPDINIICRRCGLQFCYRRLLFRHLLYYHSIRLYTPKGTRLQNSSENKLNEEKEQPLSAEIQPHDVDIHTSPHTAASCLHPLTSYVIDLSDEGTSCTAAGEGSKKEFNRAELLSASSVYVEPTSPTVKVEPTSPTAKVEPTSPTVKAEPTFPYIKVEPTSLTVKVEPTFPYIKVKPTSPTVKGEPTSPYIKADPIFYKVKVEPTSDDD